MLNQEASAQPTHWHTEANENIPKESFKKDKTQQRLINEVDIKALNPEQRAVYEVLTGKKDKIILQGRDLNDLYTLEKGSRTQGANKILIKHAGLEKTGGVSNDELLNMIEVVRKGEINADSFTQHENFIRYAYDLTENELNLRLVVEERNDGKKIFDFYSNRNFKTKETSEVRADLPDADAPSAKGEFSEPAEVSFKNEPKPDEPKTTANEVSFNAEQMPKNETDNPAFRANAGNEILRKLINQNNKKANFEAVKNIIDTSPKRGKNMKIIGSENFTPEVVEYLQNAKKKAAIEFLSEEEAKKLGFKYPKVKATLDYNAINHALKRHGEKSVLVNKSGQEVITFKDIANYRELAKTADETLKSVNNDNSPVLVSFKQINGYFVVVEQIKKKYNELGLKTIYKERGQYKNSKAYKDTLAKTQTLSIGYEPSANSFVKAKDE